MYYFVWTCYFTFFYVFYQLLVVQEPLPITDSPHCKIADLEVHLAIPTVPREIHRTIATLREQTIILLETHRMLITLQEIIKTFSPLQVVLELHQVFRIPEWTLLILPILVEEIGLQHIQTDNLVTTISQGETTLVSLCIHNLNNPIRHQTVITLLMVTVLFVPVAKMQCY